MKNIIKKIIEEIINKRTYFYHGNIVLHKYKTIYFPIADILNLHYDTSHNKIHNLNYPFIKKNKLYKYNDYFKFGFVRNPWTRAFSCYNNKIKTWKGNYHLIFV